MLVNPLYPFMGTQALKAINRANVCREILITEMRRIPPERWTKHVSEYFYMQRFGSWNEKLYIISMDNIV